MTGFAPLFPREDCKYHKAVGYCQVKISRTLASSMQFKGDIHHTFHDLQPSGCDDQMCDVPEKLCLNPIDFRITFKTLLHHFDGLGIIVDENEAAIVFETYFTDGAAAGEEIHNHVSPGLEEA